MRYLGLAFITQINYNLVTITKLLIHKKILNWLTHNSSLKCWQNFSYTKEEDYKSLKLKIMKIGRVRPIL